MASENKCKKTRRAKKISSGLKAQRFARREIRKANKKLWRGIGVGPGVRISDTQRATLLAHVARMEELVKRPAKHPANR